MSLVKKLKDILFEEEEEYTEPIKITSEKKESDQKSYKFEPPKDDSIVQVVSKPYNRLQESEVEKPKEMPKDASETPSERDLFKVDNAFQFPDFDEEEFDSSMAKNKQNANVLEYERKKKEEKRNDYNRYEKEIREPRESSEKKKFKPSPIISPVYGILNQDYKAEDIVNREEVASTIDIEEVRKKAFEMPVEVKKEEKKKVEVPKVDDVIESIDEPVVTFFDEKEKVEVKEEKKDNYKTINDLLESASVEIPLEDTLELPKTNNLDAIEEELEKIETEEKEEKKEENDSSDSDLFELIDSMYDEREGE